MTEICCLSSRSQKSKITELADVDPSKDGEAESALLTFHESLLIFKFFGS